MPKIKIDHVVSFSSEDSVFVANNILSSDPAKKWKCKQSGEISATLVLQLEKASIISGIDIGNENSAYIEVLVTRSSVLDDYKVLLVMSSFMSPLEARQNTNINKVRMFSHGDLSEPEKDQKWDRVKIVCTQPFNRHVQYGLSFVALHTPGENTSTNSPAAAHSMGNFTLRPESPNNLSIGSFFNRRTEQQKTPSVAAAIREAASSPSTPIAKAKIKPSNSTPSKKHDSNLFNLKERNRPDLLYKKEEEEPHKKIDDIIEKVKKTKNENSIKPQTSKRESLDKTVNSAKKRKMDVETNKETNKTNEMVKKPFNELLQGVTIVISGIQNPMRANLRTMALSMGAKYKADWDAGCTHLICAFTNTPKFNQVKGKGKIVKHSWIEECCSQRKRLPWRRYCLDKHDAKKAESEDEIWEEIAELNDTTNHFSPQSDKTDEEGFDDTEMQKRINQIQATNKDNKDQIEDDCYLQLTEEESIQQSDVDDLSNKLVDIFNFKTFFIDGALEKDVLKLLERYIIAYNGVVTENPSSDVDFYITSELNVSKYRKSDTQALFLRPDWIWHCHNELEFVSTDDYEL